MLPVKNGFLYELCKHFEIVIENTKKERNFFQNGFCSKYVSELSNCERLIEKQIVSESEICFAKTKNVF